jgi:hypothetical protein
MMPLERIEEAALADWEMQPPTTLDGEAAIPLPESTERNLMSLWIDLGGEG